MTSTISHLATASGRRALGAVVSVAFGVLGLLGLAPPADAARARPAPTAIVVTSVSSRTVSLTIGGSTVRNYDVFANGSRYATATPSSASLPLTISGLQADTTYAITVQENTGGRISALSAPVTVRTLAPAVIAPVTDLRATSVSGKAIVVTWTASATPGVFYEISLNGVSNQSTTRTTASVAESLNCYPGPCAGTGVKAGQINVIRVRAQSVLAGRSGDVSPVVELSVFVPAA